MSSSHPHAPDAQLDAMDIDETPPSPIKRTPTRIPTAMSLHLNASPMDLADQSSPFKIPGRPSPTKVSASIPSIATLNATTNSPRKPRVRWTGSPEIKVPESMRLRSGSSLTSPQQRAQKPQGIHRSAKCYSWSLLIPFL